MITAFDVLPTRNEKLEIPEELSFLPSSFKYYLSFYHQLYEELPLRTPKVYLSEDDTFYQLGWDNDCSNSILRTEGDRLVGMENMQNIIENLKKDTYWKDDGLLFIGSTIVNHILLNTVTGEIIFQKIANKRGNYEKSADDVIIFFQKVIIVRSEETLGDLGINPKQLYKNWEEDFWRVREE
jgi:hypothetical protein